MTVRRVIRRIANPSGEGRDSVPKETDSCKRCEHPRSDHKAPKNRVHHRTRAGDTMPEVFENHALTCCISNPLCSCIEFIEAAEEVPRLGLKGAA